MTLSLPTIGPKYGRSEGKGMIRFHKYAECKTCSMWRSIASIAASSDSVGYIPKEEGGVIMKMAVQCMKKCERYGDD